MTPPSLVQMVQNVVGRNIANLQDLGEISYDLARPILKQISNPEHLRALELSSPQIAANDSEQWKALMTRDIPNWRSKLAQPNDCNNWSYETYCKLKDQEEKERQAQEDQLRQALKQIDKKKEANKPHILRAVIQEDVKKLPDYADGRKNPLAGYSNDRKTAPVSLKNAKGGTQIIRALRQQSRLAAQAKRVQQPFGKTPARPPMGTKPLGDRPSAVFQMTTHKDRESRGQKSLRLALEAEKNKEVQEKKKRLEERKVRRLKKAQETIDRFSKRDSLSPPSTIQRRHRSSSPPPRPKPIKDVVTTTESTGPFDPDPERKSPTPLPVIALNDNQAPAMPVFVLPAACRRPVSIFAPKPKPRRKV